MQGTNSKALKSHNRALIIDCIRKQPLSRIAISQKLNLAKSAVTKITNELIEEGLIKEVGLSDSSLGRKPILLDISEEAGFVIGLVLHREEISICVSDLKSNILLQRRAYTSSFNRTDQAIGWIYNKIDEIFSIKSFPISRCVGIGVGCPGPLDHNEGVILMPPKLELFYNLPIVEILHKRYHVPVILENISVLLGLAEYMYGAIKNYQNSMIVIVSNGIGSVILNNGQIYRGSSGLAGELGHTSIDINGPQCECGGRGCLEVYATLKAFKKRFKVDSYEKLMDDAIKNIPYAVEAIDFLAKCFAGAFVNAINLFDLDSIVISGEYNYKPSLLFNLISQYVEKYSMICHVHNVAIMPSLLGENANMIASVSAILNELFNQKLPLPPQN